VLHSMFVCRSYVRSCSEKPPVSSRTLFPSSQLLNRIVHIFSRNLVVITFAQTLTRHHSLPPISNRSRKYEKCHRPCTLGCLSCSSVVSLRCIGCDMHYRLYAPRVAQRCNLARLQLYKDGQSVGYHSRDRLGTRLILLHCFLC
jgi:hypothetical protein